MNRVPVKPEILRWARERSGKDEDELSKRFPIGPWERGERHPTLKQLEAYARATHTPIGYLFLHKPHVDEVPIPDFRTMRGTGVDRPSPNMLETIYICQQRQEWYKAYAKSIRSGSLPFVGSADVSADVVKTAQEIRDTIGFDLHARKNSPTWTDALRDFIAQTEAAGILVMVNGVVGNDTHRKLDPEEFRGFAISDEVAPLVFINGSDTKAAQMFTLAHELAHIWLGQTGIDDAQASQKADRGLERWCNRIAAEVLVPLAAMRQAYQENEPHHDSLARLAREFKVSTLVILRRLHDIDALTESEFRRAYNEERKHLRPARGSGGGDYYRNVKVRAGDRFLRALITNTLEGQTLYRDALRLLGMSKTETFENLAQRMGVA